MQTEDKALIDTIVDGIKEVKGKKIVTVDMTALETYAYGYFVICEGESSTQVCAIADSVRQTVREDAGVKPFGTDGYNNAEWIAMDYGNVIVHIFQPQVRSFYQLEDLWSDAKIEAIADED